MWLNNKLFARLWFLIAALLHIQIFCGILTDVSENPKSLTFSVKQASSSWPALIRKMDALESFETSVKTWRTFLKTCNVITYLWLLKTSVRN